MHELFTQVLNNRDLSRAGDLFSVADSAIVTDLTEVLNEITRIASLPDYANNDNDQSVVEICITRVTSCIRETGSVEQHCDALVTLLESCLHHNLQISARDEDAPHAKISSDIISCIFLNYSKKSVMQRALPVAVKFLHKGNKELSRNMASYLSLAAIEHASLLSPHVQPIMDSIISGNYPLCRVLAQIYEVSPEPLQGHAMALVSLLLHCDNQEKLALLNLFSLIAKDSPELLEASVPQLCEYLSSSATAAPTLQVFLHMAEKKPAMLADHVAAMKMAAQRHPHTVCVAAQVIAAVGKLSKDRAQDALNFVLEHLPKADRGSQSTLIREATILCSSYPVLFTEKVLAGVRQRQHTSTNQIPHNQVNQTGGVTIVKVGGGGNAPLPPPLAPSSVPPQSAPSSGAPTTAPGGGYTRRKLGDSRSTGRLHTATNTNTHRSMTRLNIAGGSVGGLHKSMTRLSSSQQINAIPVTSNAVPTPPPLSNNVIVTGGNHGKWGIPGGGGSRISSGGVTVTTTQTRIPRPLSQGPLTLGVQNVTIGYVSSNHQITPVQVQSSQQSASSVTVSSVYTGPVSVGPTSMNNSASNGGNHHHSTTHTITVGSGNVSSVTDSSLPTSTSMTTESVNVSGPSTVTSRRNNNNTSVTMLNQGGMAAQRMSVFEPYPMRDMVQHFCEKHLDKIKTYMDKVSVTDFFRVAMESLDESAEKLDDRMKPIPKSLYGSVDTSSTETLEKYYSKGLQRISEGEVGVLLMAGGQGTRLGSKNPKGMFPIGIPSNKTLLQIQAERILRLEQLAQEKFGKSKPVTWYIMTSESTITATEKFLIDNDYFGLDKSNVVIFEQGHLPCFDFKGQIILDAKNRIALAPDGNGGIYRALKESNVFEDMDKRGVKYVHVYGVDNILVKVGDPTFVGYCVDKEADCGAKVVQKNHPHEAVGVVCQVDGIYQVRIPSPAKCTIEERRSKKSAKLHFACQTRGQHCLYSRTFFTMRTRNPRIWIHLMFIALQARSPHALSSRDASVTSLKHCWDMLKCENKTFLTLVTSPFPCAKDQEALLNELRHSGFFDVFQLGPSVVGGSADQLEGASLQWGCFLCTHPERAVGFLRGNTQPVIEGQLKEKKGKWRLFRRWRTRYFTLSGAHLSCRGSSGGESIDVNQIRSVKVSRGARNIPKAFEIFTGNQSLIFKPKDGKNAEEWVQCLSIIVAHSHAREMPGKSNSLPARGIGASRTAV